MPTSANGFSMSCDGGEANATKIAERAAQGPHSTADATFIEAYAKTLPALVTAALDAHEQALTRRILMASPR
jgi:hypothetical protein